MNSLVWGELTEESFKDFVERLQHHVKGEGVDRHCTDSATFVVQSKNLITGLDKYYTDKTCLVLGDEICFSFEDFISYIDDEDLDSIIEDGAPICKNGEEYTCNSNEDLFEWVEDEKGFEWSATHTGYDYRWGYVNHHMTREAAEAFIQRKKHDYGEMRVFVESAYWSWELKALMNGILDGKIKFIGE